MDISYALETVENLRYAGVLSETEEFEYTEALQYLIRETDDTGYMTELGGYYYEQRRFDLALKYYEMADLKGDKWAPEGLGYIWYYGRTGERDYKKAFEYYSRASENGYIRSSIKVADMYKNGYYVDRDIDKYNEIIEGLFDRVRNAEYTNDPLPEIYTRLAAIRADQGRTDEAIRLYMDAKDFLAGRLRYDQFFGDISIMSRLIRDMYKLINVDYADLDLFDLFEVLTRPTKVSFRYWGKEYEIEAVEEDGSIAVRFEDRWYRSVAEMLQKAKIEAGDYRDGEISEHMPVVKLVSVYDQIYDLRVV